MGKEAIIGQQQDWGPVERRLGMPTWRDQVAGLKRMTAAMHVKLDRNDAIAVIGVENLYIQILTHLWRNVGDPVGTEEFRAYVKQTVLESVLYFAELEGRPAVFKKDKGSIKITYNTMPDGLLKPDTTHLVIAANSLDGVKCSANELRFPGGGYINDSVSRATGELSTSLLLRHERRL